MDLLVKFLPSLYPETRVDTTRRRSTVFVGIDGSPFCAMRGFTDSPPCSFYSSDRSPRFSSCSTWALQCE